MSLEAGLDTPKRSSFDKEQKARLAALFIVAVLAIMSMTPLETHSQHPGDYMLVSAVMPAVIAWLFVRERPARRAPALLRGVSLVLALVGAGGLALFLAAGQLHGFAAETVGLARFPIQAGVYFVAGLLGLAGSVLFAPGD